MSLCFLLSFSVVSAEVHAFTFFGIDWSGLWEKIAFWKNSDKKADNQEKTEIEKVKKTSSKKEDNEYIKKKYLENKTTVKKTPSNKTTVSKPKPVKKEVNVDLAGINYRETDFKLMMKEQKDYVIGFGYECMYIETDKGTKFTLNFNTETGEVKSMKLGKSCEREIYIEEALITDLQENGFKAGNIKSYLEKTELPTSMYFKAIKVFTVG